MSIQEFFDKWNNKGIDFDVYYGFQCMDLAHKFAVDVNGLDFPPAPAAKDVWNKTIAGYLKIANTPEGVPQQGDIIIWGTGIGPYGHIAIFDHGNASSFTSFDQNWPVNSLCHFQNHNYNGVLGWLRLKPSTTNSPEISNQLVITDQTRIPQIGNREVQQIKSEIEAKDKALADYEKKVPALIYDAEKAQKDLKAYLEQHKEEDIEVTTITYPKPESPKTPSNSMDKPKPVSIDPAFSGPFVNLLRFLKKKLGF